MKVFFIDVEKEEVREIQIDADYDNSPSISKLIGCRLIDRVYLDAEACCYFDDEGAERGFARFHVKDRGFYDGNAIVVGTEGQGIDSDCLLTKEELQAHVSFPINRWLETYLKEKDIASDQELNHGFNVGEIQSMIINSNITEQKRIKEILIDIDHNCHSTIHFLDHLAKGAHRAS